MNIINESKDMKNKVVGWIARTEPPTNAHLSYILKLTRLYKKVVIISGSCYSLGTERHCFPYVVRKTMLKAMLDEAGISREKYEIVPLADNDSNQLWLEDVIKLCKKYNISDIASGNDWVQDILSNQNEYPLTVGDIPLDVPLSYRATDVRYAIEKGDYDKLKEYLPRAVLRIMSDYDCSKCVTLAKSNSQANFVVGRQTTDMVFLLQDTDSSKMYVLLGNRPLDSVDFPGCLALPGDAIEKFKDPDKECIRAFFKETGIEVEILEDDFVSIPVNIKGIDIGLRYMHLVGIYSSSDINKMGTRGGSSQCYSICIEASKEEFEKLIHPKSGLNNVKFYEVSKAMEEKLAFQHNEMLEKAVFVARSKVKYEKDLDKKTIHSKCIYLCGAPSVGKSTAAHGITFLLKSLGMSVENVSEFAKDKEYENILKLYSKNQAKIIGDQDFRVKRLVGQVDYIISDSPLLIAALHSSNEPKLSEAAEYLFNKTDNYIIYIQRDKSIPYETRGRSESLAEAEEISRKLYNNIVKGGYKFTKVEGSTNAVKAALDFVISNNDTLKPRRVELTLKVEKIMNMIRSLNNNG